MRLVRYAAGDLRGRGLRACEEHLAVCACCRYYLAHEAQAVAREFLRRIQAKRGVPAQRNVKKTKTP